MPAYKVSLLRGYIVTVECNNEEKAREVAEFYLTDPVDASTPQERLTENFFINSIEPTVNEVTDCEPVQL
jgi:hypothetical protein